MTMANGLFITFEGSEGVGKSTNLKFTAEWLQQKGIKTLCTREPGGTPFAEEIRTILLSARDEVVDPVAELLLVFAARAQHLNTVIRPALKQGIWVLCDRFTDATYAYQGYGRGLSLSTISLLEDFVQGALRPDRVFLLDARIDVGLQRAKSRGSLDRFESEGGDFYTAVRDGYFSRAQADPERYAVINAERALSCVQADIVVHLENLVRSL